LLYFDLNFGPANPELNTRKDEIFITEEQKMHIVGMPSIVRTLITIAAASGSYFTLFGMLDFVSQLAEWCYTWLHTEVLVRLVTKGAGMHDDYGMEV
jgi:hypothetical protein